MAKESDDPSSKAKVDALARLRAEIAAGLRELDAGNGEDLDIEEFIKQARTEDGDG